MILVGVNRLLLGKEMKTNIIVTSGDRQILSGVPIGTSIDFTGETPPSGYLVEDGSAVSRTTYARLFAVIGTKYGEGDGVTTFNLPNRPASVGYLPCIKAFDAAIDVLPESIPEITEKVWNPDEGGLDVLPGVAYIVQSGYTTKELIINSLPDSYQESTIWFPVSGELPSITINCEHNVIGDLSIPETAGKCVLSVVNKTVVMGTY